MKKLKGAKTLLQDLWESDSNLRSLYIDEYKSYLLGLIFYKYLSDKATQYVVHDLLGENILDERAIQKRYEEAYKKAEIRTSLVEKFPYVIEPQSTFTALVMQATGDELQLTQVAQAFKNIETADVFYENIFGDLNLDEQKLGKKQTEIILAIVRSLVILISDKYQGISLSDLFTELLKEISQNSGAKVLELYLPESVVKLMTQLVLQEHQAQAEFTAYDPTMGTGTLLLGLQADSDKRISYYGQELSTPIYNLARMNFIIHGVKKDKQVLSNSDALGKDWPNKGKTTFDKVLMNPPYSAKWSADKELLKDPRYANFSALAPKAKPDFAYLLHGLYHLDQAGVMAITLPHGILFRGNAEEKIRRQLIEDNVIDTIIGLPANIFHYTSIPTMIMILKKNRVNKDILFIDASALFEKGKIQNKMNDEHLKQILTAYTKRVDSDKFAHVASLEEIKENEFNLNIPRYIDTFEEEKIVIEDVMSEIQETKLRIQDVSLNLYQLLVELVDEDDKKGKSVRSFLKDMR